VKQSDLGEYKKMQEKSKIYIIREKAPTPPQTKPYRCQTLISPRRLANQEESRGLVKMSANFLSVFMYLILMSHFSTWSLRKWCLLSTCLIFLWKTGFMATKMELVLSHIRGTLSNLTSKSLMVCTIYRIWEQQLHTQPLWWIGQLKIVFEKTSKQDKIQENDKYQKCSFDQSHSLWTCFENLIWIFDSSYLELG
jgi:hypothetical protein